MVLDKEPITMTLEEHNKEQEAIREALSKPIIQVPPLNSLLGELIETDEGFYYKVLPEDSTECGLITSGAGVRIPKTVHIPTGSNVSYRKVFKVLDGKKTPVWEVHQKNLIDSHHSEPYDDIS